METVSLIREVIWNAAGWTGTAFVYDPSIPAPLALALIFKNAEAARQIFSQWREELGEADGQERLRVSIIRGISRRSPHSYRVLIGANPKSATAGQKNKIIFLLTRIQTMTPTSDLNLSRFIKNYEQLNHFYLTYALLGDSNSDIVMFYDYCILKRSLEIRDAWQIGENDLESAGILEDDDPIIPEGESDAPVSRLLRAQEKSESALN